MNQTAQQSETLPMVRARVKEVLTRSQAFNALPKDKQVELAKDMVKVAHFIVGDSQADAPKAATLANNWTDWATKDRSGRLEKEIPKEADQRKGETAGERLARSGAVAAQAGTREMGNFIQKVDFPKFVGGLIHGVFDAIVASSIKQMEAYAELVKNVAKSVDQYMKDNVTTNQARDYLAGRYPEHLEVDISGDQPLLKPREGRDEENLPDFFTDLGLSSSVSSLDDETVEQQLVPAARRRMAMDRQQLLATMVMMGINRLVVTDGKIEASVMFELKTMDKVKQHYNRASEFASSTTKFDGWKREGTDSREWQREGSSKGENSESTSSDSRKRNSSWLVGNYAEDMAQFTLSTGSTEDSEASIDLRAKLQGRVNINFKSETFPLEKMVDILQVDQIREKAPGLAPGARPAPPAPLAAAPTLPPATAPAQTPKG